MDADGAEIAVEGALDLSVVHRERSRWTMRVGPFQVHVIGKRFEIRWDPQTEQFGVALREGAFSAYGLVMGDARAVRAGERLVVSPATNSLEVGPIDATTLTDAAGRPQPRSAAAAATSAAATSVGGRNLSQRRRPQPRSAAQPQSAPAAATSVGGRNLGQRPNLSQRRRRNLGRRDGGDARQLG